MSGTMCNRRSIVVERKSFTVEFSKDVVQIGEKSKKGAGISRNRSTVGEMGYEEVNVLVR